MSIRVPYPVNHTLLMALRSTALSLALTACLHPAPAQPTAASIPTAGLTRFVDPRIGTGFHGHVFMGANVPFGAVQLGPSQLSTGWDWCSGYHVSDSTIVGFAHTHLNGTGIGDLGDILLMPTTGPVRLHKGTPADPAKGVKTDWRSGYTSLFRHATEQARPGYYAVRLDRYNIGVELTATERVGFHRYTFPKAKDAHILIDLQEGVGWDRATDTYLEKLNDTTLVGYRYSKGWAPDQRIYVALVFAKPIRSLTLYQDETPVRGRSARGPRTKGVVSFATRAGDQVLVKVGVSPVSSANALANLRAEVPHWRFDQVVASADAAWNRALGRVRVETADRDRLKVFYTALYHTLTAPSIFNDRNGDYRGADGQVHTGAGFTNLTTFSLWDTYRAAHPLHTLLHPTRVGDMINSMLAIFEQQGKLPVWHLVGNETNTMPGNSAIPVVADAILKGIGGFDVSKAYQAMKASAMLDERGLNWVKQTGYIPADAEVENVAKGLEFAIDDWCLAQVARKLGQTADYAYFSKRGQYYRNYFDPQTRFMRGRVSDSTWRTPFSPFVSRHMKDDFTEGNAWQYTWLVPQDVEGLMTLQGGEGGFVQKLDSLFVAKGDLGEEASGDITGLIGQYAHGNEPSHHITYLYAYAGQPWKTADKVRYILDSLYASRPDGLCGNEDVGQMSAWYVLSAMGFYPVNPANGLYVFGSPVFDEVTLNLDAGRTFRIRVKNNSARNRYIQRMRLNGKPYTRSYLRHSDILAGGDLVIEMGDQPSRVWGVAPADRPRSMPE
ncbi:GH92 family glycosyl hydrolase [Spirosoma luteolum]